MIYLPPLFFLKRRGMKTLRQLNRPQITALISRLSDKARREAATASHEYFTRSVGIVIRAADAWKAAPMPKTPYPRELWYIALVCGFLAVLALVR